MNAISKVYEIDFVKMHFLLGMFISYIMTGIFLQSMHQEQKYINEMKILISIFKKNLNKNRYKVKIV